MKTINDFRNFALRSTVMDFAIGVTVGTAFVKIVSVLVQNVIMPPIGMIIGDVDFSHLRIVLKAAGEGHSEVSIGYGLFIQELFNFLLIAWAMFFIIRAATRLREDPKAPPAPAASEEVMLLREIRDLLRVNKGQS